MDLSWEDGFKIDVATDDVEVTISANREGLLSLANHLRSLAVEPVGAYVYLDEHNALEDGSCALVIEKVA